MERPLGGKCNHANTLSSNPKAEHGGGLGEGRGAGSVMTQRRQIVPPANILLLLRGSPLAGVSTQLCSVATIQRETKDAKRINRQTLRERQQNVSDRKGRTRHCI